ncbi:MAG: hypothetical protein HQ513_08470 [Rhodospirillales bacterium]|nr:hypothetical protein [Rhodospirillales bacterium]
MSKTLSPDEKCAPEDDSAWVAIETPFAAAWLAEFLNDVERLFRINSQLVFTHWEDLGNNEYRFEVNNLSNEKTVNTGFKAIREGDTLTLTYSEGLKTTTTFRLDPQPDGTANLSITDDYSGTSVDEREARIDEVDKSLVQWGRDLRLYLLMWKKWEWVPGWKWYKRRVWQPMRPMARRICTMLLLITFLEFVVFLMVFTIFWLELDKYLD